VGFLKDGVRSAQLAEVADELRDEYEFSEVDGDASKFGISGKDQVVLFKPADEKQVVYSGDLTAAAMKEWLLLNALPVLPDLSLEPELADKVAARKLPTLFLFVNNKAKETPAIRATASKLSKAYSGKYSVVTMNSSEKEKMGGMGIDTKQIPDPAASVPDDWSEEDDGAWEAPLVEDLSCKVAIDSANGKVHFVLPKEPTSAAISKEVLEQFLKDHAECSSGSGTCKLTKAIKSAATPVQNDEPVKVVVGNTFEEIVMDDTKDVLIEFYAPWCGHCKKLAPIFDQLGTKLAPSTDLVIAKMDASENDVPDEQFDVTGFPTLYFKPAGGSPKLYEDERTVSGFVDYLKKEAKHPVKTK